LAWIAHRKRPTLPPEVRTAVLAAVNELEVAHNTHGRDAQPIAESIAARLKSVL
jgi:hypothetical protein